MDTPYQGDSPSDEDLPPEELALYSHSIDEAVQDKPVSIKDVSKDGSDQEVNQGWKSYLQQLQEKDKEEKKKQEKIKELEKKLGKRH